MTCVYVYIRCQTSVKETERVLKPQRTKSLSTLYQICMEGISTVYYLFSSKTV